MAWGSCHHRYRPLWVVHFERRSHQTETGVINVVPHPLSSYSLKLALRLWSEKEGFRAI